MHSSSFSDLTFIAIQAALQAGDILMKGFGTSYKISLKPGKQNVVTIHDYASEKAIINILQSHFPEHVFLAEESGLSATPGSSIVWIIDPLDGTFNFAHHIPLFTISIAAYQNNTALCGVIFQPVTHELFVAEKGKGAYLNGMPLKVSSIERLDQALIGTGWSLLESETQDLTSLQPWSLLIHSGVLIRNLGSAALCLAYVAAGKLDGFYMNFLYPWDYAAGKLLIEEAGGCITNHQNHTLNILKPSSVIAANFQLHSLLYRHLFND